jgi:hypothetical protein
MPAFSLRPDYVTPEARLGDMINRERRPRGRRISIKFRTAKR